MKTGKNWNNNKGVTILEVILAVVILAIVVIPVARAIILSAKFHYKARERQKLTTLSENLMEEFKAYSVDEMYEKFTGSSLQDWFRGGEIGLESCYTVKTNEDDGSVLFQINQFKVDSISYDAQIKVTPVSAYQDVVLTQLQDYNVKQCATCEIRDRQASALQDVRDHFESNYAEKFLEVINSREHLFSGDNSIKKEDIDFDRLRLLERMIEINVLQNGENYDVYYEVVYRYKMQEYPYHKDKEGTEAFFDFGPVEAEVGEGDCFEFTAVSHRTVYARSKEDGLQRLYVFYYPLYAGALGNTVTDYVIINSDAIRDMDVYFLKQRDTSLGEAVRIYEGSYSPCIQRSGDFSHSMKLYHNLERNVAGGIGNTNYVSSVNGFSNGSGHGENVSEALQREKNNLLYQVDIEILKQGESVSKLSGTIKE